MVVQICVVLMEPIRPHKALLSSNNLSEGKKIEWKSSDSYLLATNSYDPIHIYEWLDATEKDLLEEVW